MIQFDDFTDPSRLVLMAGPCVIESEEHVQRMADAIAPIAAEAGFSYVFKASFDKANRTSLEAGRSGRIVNIKKGQFVAPHDMRHAAEKVASTGNTKVVLTERGSSFGYNNLVVDMRGLKIMAEGGWPVVFDATHSVQLPSGAGGVSGGQPQFIEPLASAAVAVGVAGIFVEVHDKPEEALSDGPNALRLDLLPAFLRRLRFIDQARRA